MDETNANQGAQIPPKRVNLELVPLGTSTEVRGRLALLGWKSLNHWAEVHGYVPVTARSVVRVWVERNKIPHGGIARHLMAALRQTLETGKRPEHMPKEQ